MSKRGKNQVVAPKPVPADLRAWVNEVIGVKRFVDRAAHADYQPNQIWIDKQHKYWAERLEKLLTTPPDIPSRHYWRRIVDEILSKRRGRGRPKINRFKLKSREEL